MYSRRLAGPATLTNTPTQILTTVPVGEIWVVRWMSVLNNSATITSTVRVGIGSANVGANRIFRRLLAVEENFYLELRVPLIGGESIGAYADNGGVVALTLTGFKFVDA